MRLYEFKAKYLAKITLYEPKNEREQELVNLITRKLHNLRMFTLPDLIITLRGVRDEPVSDDFRAIVKEMIEDILKLESKEESKE